VSEGLGEVVAALRRMSQLEEEGQVKTDEGLWEAHMQMKWRVVDDGMFTSVGRTVRTMPPGVYDIIADARGHTYFQEMVARDDEIIRFPEMPIDEVVGEIERFWGREEAFKNHGLPFKRGILLYGPPGSGKSCTLQLVAREMIERGGYVVPFRTPALFLRGYRMLRQVQPNAPIVVLMEDLDEILKGKSSVGESEILNLLDGIESTHKVVFLATTNYPRALGARIFNRPSRFDRRILVGHPTAASRRTYLERLVREGDMFDIDKMARDAESMSLAHLKELFVSTVILGSPYEQTLKALRAMNDFDPSEYEEPAELAKTGAGRGFL
jgi:AAA+ superfamily predicted ATPase